MHERMKVGCFRRKVEKLNDLDKLGLGDEVIGSKESMLLGFFFGGGEREEYHLVFLYCLL